MDRRSFGRLAFAGVTTGLARPRREAPLASPGPPSDPGSTDLAARWQKLDDAIRGWWDADLHRADENAVRDDPARTLLFLPHAYSSGGGSEAAFPELYGWDTAFINLALLEHGRADIVRGHILDQLSMIDRFGKVLNGNRTYYLTRGQPPLLAWSVELYLAERADDEELALRAYAGLQREYESYWNGPGHLTPTGLATCRDSGARDFRPELESECEAGLDFTPIFDGDVRRCVPVHVNVALVRCTQTLASLATRFGWRDRAATWQEKADERARRIDSYCWDGDAGAYLEYDYVRAKRLPFYSLNTFWPLWAGIASKDQARRVVQQHLPRFDQPFGLAFTDREYPSPHPEYRYNEWAYPEAWPPQQIVVALALQRYGYDEDARRVSRRYIENVVDTWEKTGHTWERYNAVSGGHEVPVERQPPQPLHGFSSAAAVVVGRVALGHEGKGGGHA